MYVEAGYVDDGYFIYSATTAAFVLGAASLIFSRAPQRPPQSLTLYQAEAVSAGGDRFGHAVFASDDEIELVWPRMASFTLDQLRTFWEQYAKGMAIPFVYRDHWGVSHSVRFATPDFPEVRQKTPDRYEVSLRLRRES